LPQIRYSILSKLLNTSRKVKLINFQILTINDIVLFSSLALVFIIQLYYLLRYYLKLAIHKDEPVNQISAQITVVLPVRNEEERIREIVNKFNDQQFDDYQLLLINVNSEDNTFGILNVLAETNPKLKVTSLSQETRFSEKQAINIGLKGASSPWILFITPTSGNISPEWMARLSGMLSAETDAVIAYTNVERGKGMRNLICRLERFNQFMISGAWTLAGMPFVFNENNVLFKKSMYFDTLGFRHKLNRNFANLELIFNENFIKGRVKIATSAEMTIREQIEDDRGDHIRLIKKGVQIRQSLSWGKKLSLFADDFTKILLAVLSVVVTILHPEYWITILSLPFIYLLLLIIIVNLLLNRLNERKLFVSSFVYILIKPIINWWFFWYMYLINRRSRWN
jgi:biofilm PGA synthesis N-glycosyltransferase PgaC